MKRSHGVRPRPATLRALGVDDPPLRIEVNGAAYTRATIFKHDSVAATALYESPQGKIVCKFNRRQAFVGLPSRWLGRLLARREAQVLRLLENVPNIPRLSGEVFVAGAHCENAVAHEYIEGRPLRRRERVGDQFFPALERTLAEMHKRDVGCGDLNKRENIIVGDDGMPYLIDFQISLFLSNRWPGNSRMARAVIEWMKAADRYHLQKHYARSRPDLFGMTSREMASLRPWKIRLHRGIAAPFRKVRRRLLVALGVRSGRGFANSEHFAEEGARNSTASECDRHKTDRS